MWVEGQHAGVCRHLGLLKKYHKPFAKKIWTDLVVHGIAPTDIPELVELRHRLGLSRPQADYQELLDGAQTLQELLPTDIPGLAEFRHRLLGLSRPHADYQELLDGAQSRRLDLVQLVLPRKDGTVRIGSFPRPI